MIRVALFVIALVASAAQGQTVACPATVQVTAAGAKVERPFERVSIYNGKQGGEEYELAPDDEKTTGRKIVQSWFLKDYRSMNLFMRCRYRGTEVTRSIDLPPRLETCTFTFELQKDGTITGKPQAVCR